MSDFTSPCPVLTSNPQGLFHSEICHFVKCFWTFFLFLFLFSVGILPKHTNSNKDWKSFRVKSDVL